MTRQASWYPGCNLTLKTYTSSGPCWWQISVRQELATKEIVTLDSKLLLYKIFLHEISVVDGTKESSSSWIINEQTLTSLIIHELLLSSVQLCNKVAAFLCIIYYTLNNGSWLFEVLIPLVAASSYFAVTYLQEWPPEGFLRPAILVSLTASSLGLTAVLTSIGLTGGCLEVNSAQTARYPQSCASLPPFSQDLGDKTASCSPTINFLHERGPCILLDGTVYMARQLISRLRVDAEISHLQRSMLVAAWSLSGKS